jgi:hypothetical protein
MKIQNSIKAAIGALLIGAASQAAATVVAVNATGLPTYLNNTTSLGSFDASFLPGQYTINSIGFSFSFADDTDTFASVAGTSSTQTSAPVYSTSDKSFLTTTTVTVPVTRTGEQESVLLSFGGHTFSGQTSLATSGPTRTSVTDPQVRGSDIYAKNGVACTADQIAHDNSCKKTASYTVTVTNTDTTTKDYTGNIALANSLLSYDTVLAELLNNRSLGFSLGVTGDLNLTGATLTVDYTDTTPPPAHDVPEPGTLALFGIALLGATGIRRARRG